MSCNLTDPLLIQSYQRILDPGSVTGYLVAGYGGSRDTVQLYCEGDGGFEEMRKTVLELQEVLFIFIRIQHKYALITFISDGISGVRRARALVHGRQVADLFDRNDLHLTIASASELKLDSIEKRLKLTSCPQWPAERRRESLLRDAHKLASNAFGQLTGDLGISTSGEMIGDHRDYYDDVKYDFDYIPPAPQTPLSPEVHEVCAARQSFIKFEDEDTSFDNNKMIENSLLFESSPSQSNPSGSMSDSHSLDAVQDMNLRDLSKISFEYDHSYHASDDDTEYGGDDDFNMSSTPIIPPRTKKGSMSSNDDIADVDSLMEINESLNQGRDFKLRLYRITGAGKMEIFSWGKERPELIRSFAIADIEKISLHQAESMLTNSVQFIFKNSQWIDMDDYLVYFNSKTDLGRFMNQVRV